MLIRNPVRYGNGELHCAAADVTGLSGRRDIARRIQARSGRSQAVADIATSGNKSEIVNRCFVDMVRLHSLSEARITCASDK